MHDTTENPARAGTRNGAGNHLNDLAHYDRAEAASQGLSDQWRAHFCAPDASMSGEACYDR